MKKVGILFGKERSFPEAFVERVNAKKPRGIIAEYVHVDEVVQGKATDYAVIIDRISQDVPFYRAYLKNAAICGTHVINNPFWWSADEKFFNNSLAEVLKVPVPKTILLPSKEMPEDTSGESFSNLKFPLEWDKMVEYLGGFPLYMKPHAGGGWKSVYKVRNMDELFHAYNETGNLVMMLQEEINFEAYFRCYYLGGKVRVMPYEPRNPHHLRYLREPIVTDQKMLDLVEKLVVKLNEGLGYDFNTVEFAIQDGIPYAIDFCNPAPDADIRSVGADNFEWVVENAAEMAIKYARAYKPKRLNLSWGSFVTSGIDKKLPK
jgi:hypothetical protein